MGAPLKVIKAVVFSAIFASTIGASTAQIDQLIEKLQQSKSEGQAEGKPAVPLPTSAQECLALYQATVSGVAACIKMIPQRYARDALLGSAFQQSTTAETTALKELSAFATQCLESMQRQLLAIKQHCGAYLPQFAGAGAHTSYCVALRAGANACRANARSANTRIFDSTGGVVFDLEISPDSFCASWDNAVAKECPGRNATNVSLTGYARCSQERQAAQTCYESCRSPDVDRAACRNNCEAYESDLLKMCGALETPKTVKRLAKTKRAVSGKTETATPKVATTRGANTQLEQRLQKNNLDRFDLGPTFVDPSTSTAGARTTARGTARAASKVKTTGSSDAVSKTSTSPPPQQKKTFQPPPDAKFLGGSLIEPK